MAVVIDLVCVCVFSSRPREMLFIGQRNFLRDVFIPSPGLCFTCDILYVARMYGGCDIFLPCVRGRIIILWTYGVRAPASA
jgi:hypothetical protein